MVFFEDRSEQWGPVRELKALEAVLFDWELEKFRVPEQASGLVQEPEGASGLGQAVGCLSEVRVRARAKGPVRVLVAELADDWRSDVCVALREGGAEFRCLEVQVFPCRD